MLIDNKTIFSRISDIRDLWQMDFLELEKFADFVKSRGYYSFNKDTLKALWKLGLFRADFVHSKRKLTLKNINYIGKNEQGLYIYSDCRSITRRNRLVDVPKKDMVVQPWIALYFHPFRYYLITHFARILDFNLHPLQLMLSSKGSHRMIDRYIGLFGNMLRTNPKIYDRLEYWHGLTEMAIATEPCVYEDIFHRISCGGDMSFSEYSSIMADYWLLLEPYYASIREGTIDEYRGDICIEAETLNRNKDVNMLLRMMDGQLRLNLEGEIGGAVYLHTMAEVLRRGYEKATGRKLKEEDELGFGHMPSALKTTLYGAGRILDNRSARNFYLQQHSLSFGMRLHWYVEGHTECGALESVFKESSAIGIINLLGKVVRNKGASFIESLKQDVRSGIFSMVSIDGDLQNNIQAVKGAARDDAMCGMFFIAEPDFEFHNFSRRELIEVFASQVERSSSRPIDRDRMLDLARGCNNASELITMFNAEVRIRPGIKKGKELGALLCEYAFRHRYMEDGRTPRPFLQAIDFAMSSIDLNFNITYRRMKVDPDTGMLIERTKP